MIEIEKSKAEYMENRRLVPPDKIEVKTQERPLGSQVKYHLDLMSNQLSSEVLHKIIIIIQQCTWVYTHLSKDLLLQFTVAEMPF